MNKNRLSDRLLKSLIEASPVAIFDLDREGKVKSIWNDAAQKIFGWKKEEVLGKKLPIVPKDKKKEFDRLLEQVLSGESLTSVEVRRQKKDGTPIEVSISSAPVKDEDGKIVAIMSYVAEITERKKIERLLRENEKKFREIFNKANDAIYLHKLTEEGMPGRFLEVNEVAMKMLGYSKEEFLSMSPQDIDAREKAPELPKIMEDFISKGQITFEMVHQAKDGTKIPVEINSHLFELENEKRVLSVARDITERKEKEEELKKERAKLRKLHDAVDKFQQCQTEKDLFECAVETTRNILNFELCAFYCVEAEKLVPVAGSKGMNIRKLPLQKLNEGIAGQTYQKRESIVGENLQEEEKAVLKRTDLKGYMSVPIGDLGVFQAASKKKGFFDKTDVELAEILAGHLNEEVKRIRLEEELKHQAIKDPLTGLNNRRYFEETLQKEVERSKRYHIPLAFIMIDVNRFKEINDRFSHQTGDDVLKEVANILEKNFRSADTVIRYGGDEFLVMMPQTDGGVEKTITRLKK
ncbi:PAS domain S-box protein, partial [bacterium]|nr:PAS domain S-box protein [bacterium]